MPQTDIAKAKAKAKRLGVTVEASKRKHKKLDVFKDGKRVASIGDLRYSDFLQHGDEERRRRYKARHSPHRLNPFTQERSRGAYRSPARDLDGLLLKCRG